MKIGWLLALVVCGCAHGATTTIRQSRIAAGDGRHLATGTITITATSAFTAADGAQVDTTPLTVQVVNGAFMVSLEPNAGTGSTYVATWQLDGAKARQDRWLVPATGAVLAVSDVLLGTITLPAGWAVQWAQLVQNGASVGQTPVWNGASWVPAPGVPGVQGNPGQQGQQGIAGATGASGAGDATSYSQAFTAGAYSSGTVAVTTGGTAIAGTGTVFTAGMDGWWLRLSGDSMLYRVSYVSPTALATVDPIQADTAAGISFTLVQPVLIPGATHLLGTSAINVQCYDLQTPAQLIPELSIVTVFKNQISFNVEVVFWGAQGGTCTLQR